MPSLLDRLTASEAAVVSDVALRDVNRVIDEQILPTAFYSLSGGRRLRLAACPLVDFYFHSADVLTADERLAVIRRVAERTGPVLSAELIEGLAEYDQAWTVVDRFVTISLSGFARAAFARWTRLEAARRIVVEDADVLGGVPVIRGTRVPVHDLAASVLAGIPHERIRAAYGGLDDETIDLATLYARAAPPRGRPRVKDRLKPGARLVQSRVQARRTKA